MNATESPIFKLNSSDPKPFKILGANRPSPIVVVCDHAGRKIPSALKHLAPAKIHMKRHIACDNGARKTAKLIARKLNAPLVVQRYSRLVVDCNRPIESPQSMPSVSDGTAIGFNQGICKRQRQARLNEIYYPYHRAITDKLDERDNRRAALVAIHSFTPYLRNGPYRNWHVDLITRSDLQFALDMQSALQKHCPNLNIGIGQVFQLSDTTDFTLPYHGESRNIPNISIEVRNDLLKNNSSIKSWADLLSRCLEKTLPL